jgi:hypothetical protein
VFLFRKKGSCCLRITSFLTHLKLTFICFLVLVCLHYVRGEFAETFQNSLWVPSSLVNWPVKMGPSGSSETSVNSLRTSCKTPETRKQCLFHGESLKSWHLSDMPIHFYFLTHREHSSSVLERPVTDVQINNIYLQMYTEYINRTTLFCKMWSFLVLQQAVDTFTT